MRKSDNFFLFSAWCAALIAFCVFAETLNAAEDEAPKYLGPGSCAATSCHGSVKLVADSRILQDEYSTWIIKDKHSKAYQALTSDIGERMARILKLGAKAEEAPKCLACHSLYATAGQRGRPFDIAEGVSCENCHGPSSAGAPSLVTTINPLERSQCMNLFFLSRSSCQIGMAGGRPA